MTPVKYWNIPRLLTPLEPVPPLERHKHESNLPKGQEALGELEASAPESHISISSLSTRSTNQIPYINTMMSFRTFLPLSQPSFVEMPQLLGLKTIQQSKPVNKCSLNFILSNDNANAKPALLPSFPWTSPQRGSSNKTFAPVLAPPSGPCKIAKRRRLQNASVSYGSTKVSGKAGMVLADGTIVKKGSKYCMVEGCTSRAKHARRCWRHGGSVKCMVPDCANRAKTKGVCWSHGGGTLCSFSGCSTISVSNGVCWAHGGGKRCAMEGCARPAYERTDHLCTLHFEEKQYISQHHSNNTQCHHPHQC